MAWGESGFAKGFNAEEAKIELSILEKAVSEYGDPDGKIANNIANFKQAYAKELADAPVQEIASQQDTPKQTVEKPVADHNDDLRKASAALSANTPVPEVEIPTQAQPVSTGFDMANAKIGQKDGILTPQRDGQGNLHLGTDQAKDLMHEYTAYTNSFGGKHKESAEWRDFTVKNSEVLTTADKMREFKGDGIKDVETKAFAASGNPNFFNKPTTAPETAVAKNGHTPTFNSEAGLSAADAKSVLNTVAQAAPVASKPVTTDDIKNYVEGLKAGMSPEAAKEFAKTADKITNQIDTGNELIAKASSGASPELPRSSYGTHLTAEMQELSNIKGSGTVPSGTAKDYLAYRREGVEGQGKGDLSKLFPSSSATPETETAKAATAAAAPTPAAPAPWSAAAEAALTAKMNAGPAKTMSVGGAGSTTMVNAGEFKSNMSTAALDQASKVGGNLNNGGVVKDGLVAADTSSKLPPAATTGVNQAQSSVLSV